MATASVVASGAGKLDAFIDFNGNGSFADAGEKVFDNVSVVAGNNVLQYNVPLLSKSGKVFARFRLSTAGGLSFNGAAADGEVEDHQFTIKPLFDYGDAPDSYATTKQNGGARHALSPLFLGTRIDDESDGQPSDDATGDDFAPLGQPSDEDGVNMPALVRGQLVTISVVSSGAGKLDAWVDFENDGYFNSYEKVIDSIPVVAGNNQLSIQVADYIGNVTSFARFRLSSAGNLGPTGDAADGEVEDYQVTFDFGTDFGDAPDSYHTLLSSDGPRHKLGRGPSFDYVDPEAEGQPSTDATGDDNNGNGFDNDEQDVFIPAMSPGRNVAVFADIYSEGYVDAWVDFDGNGQFDSTEKVVDSQFGDYYDDEFDFSVPAGAKIGTTFARFRISSKGGLGPTGEAPDGEVEDYQVNIVEPIDYGDAPESYGTLKADGGPSHNISDLYLGGAPDAEADGIPSFDGSGDDFDNQDDEDGVFFFNDFLPGLQTTIEVDASGPGKLDGFFDFNGNGNFDDPGEKVFDSIDVVGGDNELNVPVPIDGINNDYTFARFRISSAGGLGPGGAAPDGEVEDRRLFIEALPADLAVTKNQAASTVKPGANLIYTITVENLGPGDGQNVELSDDIPDGTSFVSATGPDGWQGFFPDPEEFFQTVYFDRNTFSMGDGPAVFTITVKVNSNASLGSVITNHPYISAYDSPDGNSDNNFLNATTTVSNTTPSSGVAISVVTDPADSTKKALKIVGTGSGEKIEVLKSGSTQGKATVKINGTSKGTFNFTGHIVVYGGAGNDTISIDTAITRSAFIFAEGGNDVVNGGGGADVAVGGTGNDKLSGRGGRDILFGGSGADTGSGGDGDDILLAGKSDYDSSIPNLAKLQKEWIRTDKTYAQRVTDIKNGGGLNGTVKLTKSTADSTIGSIDNLTGDANNDLFFANLVAAVGKPKDVIMDKTGTETAVDLD
jgi:uncharacterized repeat protein (TIGR01451 family)